MLWSEALRMLVRQEAVLITMRNQAVAMLSAGAVAAGLFGSHLSTGHGRWWVVPTAGIALALFAASAVLAAMVAVPTKWLFSHDLTRQVERLSQGQPLRAYDLAFTWAKGFETARATNQVKLDRLTLYYRWVCGLLIAQVVIWGLAVL